MKVLVADDDRAIRTIIVRLLGSIGVKEIVEACDGQEALQLFEQQTFDLVVTDWEMPGNSGVEVIRAIRAKGSQVPIIMVTVNTESKQVRKAIEAGASDFLGKPFKADVLQGKLERFCQHINALKQLKQNTGSAMRVEYMNPFITSVISLFDTMLDTKLTRGQPFVKDTMQPEHEISGIIGLTGKAKGVVVLSLSTKSALGAAGVLLGEQSESVDADVIDAVGELTNIVAGGAKAQLEQLEMSISLPTVITGKDHSVAFPSNVPPVCIPFDCKWGPVTVEVGLVEQAAEVLVTA
jgi:chemotaxis protein CheX